MIRKASLRTIGPGVSVPAALILFFGLTFAPAALADMQRRLVLSLPKLRSVIRLAAVLLALAGLGLLAVTASQQPFSETDLEIAQWVQGLDFPGLGPTLKAVNVLTDAHMAIAFWVVAGAFLVLRGRPLEAIAVFLISFLWVGDAMLSVVVDRPSPAAEVAAKVGFYRGASFPSGHVTGAVAFYGLLAFLTVANVRRGRIRVIIPAVSLLMIAMASIGRVYASAHWPSDILGSYLFASLGVYGIASLYCRVKEDRPCIPRRGRKQRAPHCTTGITTARSIASTVYLDPQAGTATKEYNPPLPVRALYRAAFQASFPYQGNRDALEAAAAKRKIAADLTSHWFGQDMVAQVYDIRNGGGSYQFVTEYVPGTTPVSNAEIAGALSELYTRFQEAGLPTWQIAPGNPHAYSNFLRTAQGDLKLIDLESALVSVSYPWQELPGYLRDGSFPVFDDVDFPKLRRYVNVNEHALTVTLGRAGVADLEHAIEVAERYTQSWKDSEPRIWGRLARRAYRMFNVKGLLDGIRARLDGAEAMARGFVGEAIERWEREGQIDSARAASLRSMLLTSEAQSLFKHLGAHMALTVAIAIPIPGLRSAARFAWTLAFRIRALYALGRGRISREEYLAARSIHSVPVMLLALVPALGAVSYAASDTMLKRGLGRMLLDQSAHKVPFGLYRRLRLARITAPRSREFAGGD
jgi:membrane-associated phospholipid phosphatase